MSRQESWAEGYVADVAYEANYFRDLGPDYLRACLLLHGIDLPRRKKDEPLRCLELGYGQGLNMAVSSAAVPGEFWGTDFNPDHTLRATELAQSAQLESQLLNYSFAEMDARAAAGGLPEFDVIALHGVWSWINDENRRHILNIIHRNLKMGGAVYVSYNALPGWAPFMPVRDLMVMYADTQEATGLNSQELLTRAYQFVHGLAEAEAEYFLATPAARARLESLEGKSLAYLVHEYLNRDWRPFYFADVAAAMGLAKCSFVTSTRLLNQLDVCVPPKTLPLLRQAATPEMRETLRDFGQNQQFRADVFVKGSHRLSRREHMSRMGALRVALACQIEAVSLAVATPTGQVNLREDIYNPLLAALADADYAPKTLEQLEDHPLLKNMSSAALNEAVSVLMGAGYLHPAREAAPAQVTACARLNRQLCERARQGEASHVLASPVLGSGVVCTRVEQLVLLSRAEGGEGPAQWAEDALNALSARGEYLQKDGEKLSREEALQTMSKLAHDFAVQRLPWLTAMHCLPEAGLGGTGEEPTRD